MMMSWLSLNLGDANVSSPSSSKTCSQFDKKLEVVDVVVVVFVKVVVLVLVICLLRRCTEHGSKSKPNLTRYEELGIDINRIILWFKALKDLKVALLDGTPKDSRLSDFWRKVLLHEHITETRPTALPSQRNSTTLRPKS